MRLILRFSDETKTQQRRRRRKRRKINENLEEIVEKIKYNGIQGEAIEHSAVRRSFLPSWTLTHFHRRLIRSLAVTIFSVLCALALTHSHTRWLACSFNGWRVRSSTWEPCMEVKCSWDFSVCACFKMHHANRCKHPSKASSSSTMP